MENLHNMKFSRRFSVNFFKSLKLPLSEMSFFKDFINDTRGDPYPLLDKDADTREYVAGGHYFVHGTAERLMGDFFPYATYEVTLAALEGSCGFGFRTPLGNAHVLVTADGGGRLSLVFDGTEFPTERKFQPNMALLVTARKNVFEIYFNYGDMPEFIA